MKPYAIGGVIVGLCLCLMAPIAFATTLTGQILSIRISTGSGGSPRLSIRMPGNTVCSNNGWFAYEGASTGLGLVRTHGLLAAYKSFQPVTIVGTGTCDVHGVERINFIDLN